MSALHNSLERQELDSPKCHPKTRLAVLNRLVEWINNYDDDILILWLYGAAGAGKSAIAHTLAEICERDDCLLATFFFWRTSTERRNAARFVATLAYQISRAIPASRPLIEDAVASDPMVFDLSIDTQLVKLIFTPLYRLKSTGFNFNDVPFVVIIDGLDECQGHHLQSVIVKSLAAGLSNSQLGLRILITSRPEVHLRTTFNSSIIDPYTSRLALSSENSSRRDIYRFLEVSFEKIKKEHPLSRYIPSWWPPWEALQELSQKSSGQFVFASTAIKYIGGDPCELPTRRLDVIRQVQPPRGEQDLPYGELDALYHHVLSNVRNIEGVKQVLGARLIIPVYRLNHSEKLLGTSAMDEFLFWRLGEVEACLSQLASLITYQADGTILVHHASLVDFLLDRSRSRQFYLHRETVLGDCAALALRHLHERVDPGGMFY